MNTNSKYKNRTAELHRLIEVLYRQGVKNIEELTTTFKDFVNGYAKQLHIEPLTFREVEYIWMHLIE